MVNVSKVFRGETLVEPALEECHEGLDHIVSAFGLNTKGVTKSIKKPSPTSRLYEFNNNTPYILRAAPTDIRDSAEAQCFVFNALADQICIKPLMSNGGNYTFQTGDEFWTCYPKVAGHQTLCMPENLDNLLAAAQEFERGIIGISQTSRIENIPFVDMRASFWPNMIDEIEAGFQDSDSLLYGHLSSEVHDLLTSMKLEIGQRLEALTELTFERELVHYDMHHANIIQSPDGSLCFIDFEDIVWADRKVALAHAIFKWARQCIYLDANSFSEVVTWLKYKCPENLSEFAVKPGSVGGLENYILARIFSDLALIIESVTKDRKLDFVYDYNKKVSNLIEALLLFEHSGGLHEL